MPHIQGSSAGHGAGGFVGPTRGGVVNTTNFDQSQLTQQSPLTGGAVRNVGGVPITPGQFQAPLVTGAARDFSQFGDINTQNAIRGITNDLGLSNAANVINGVIVDSNGNPIAGAPSEAVFNNLLQQRLSQPNLNIVPSNNGNFGPSPVAPPTGLIGSEAALTGGLTGAEAALREGLGLGAGAIEAGAVGAESLLREGIGFGINELQAANLTGQQQLISAADQAASRGVNTFGIATDQLSERFGDPGFQANQKQAALSGALGPEAQAQAFQSFTESPGQQFLRDQQEQALLRNAGATGGLGGGRVLEALQRQAAGNASQNFQQNFQNLGEVAGRGLTAEQQRAQIGGALGGQVLGQLANLNLRGVDLTQSTANQLANLGLTGGTVGAGIRQTEGQQLASLGQTGATVGAQLFRGTGQDLAAGRQRAGELIAANIGGTTTALADLANQQGAGISSTIGTAGGNLANILSGAGQLTASQQQQLSALLANIATGQGSQAGGLATIPGTQAAGPSAIGALVGGGLGFVAGGPTGAAAGAGIGSSVSLG